MPLDVSGSVMEAYRHGARGWGHRRRLDLIVATSRWAEVPTALRDQLGTRFELRLGDSMDSMINMRAAATIPRRPVAA
ncbi:hypothetical protein SCALM49S_03694 [Streptomyces californicus]